MYSPDETHVHRGWTKPISPLIASLLVKSLAEEAATFNGLAQTPAPIELGSAAHQPSVATLEDLSSIWA